VERNPECSILAYVNKVAASFWLSTALQFTLCKEKSQARFEQCFFIRQRNSGALGAAWNKCTLKQD
jgi:dynactin complex subunit